jgi:hypothetical protein
VDRTRLPFSLESAFHQIEVRVRNPNSSSHAVPGNTTSAKRRAVSFMNKSTQTTMSILARPRATWPASANDESMLVPRSCKTFSRPLDKASAISGIWLGSVRLNPGKGEEI